MNISSLLLKQYKEGVLFVISRSFASKKHKKIIKMAKGYRGRANRCFTVAIQRVEKGLLHAYRDRRVKRRDFRKLWIQKINAGSRMYGVPYSKLIPKLEKANIQLNRKILADFVEMEPYAFRGIIEIAKNPN